MRRNRQALIPGLGLWLLVGAGPAPTSATVLPARLHPAGTIDTSFSDSTQQPGRALTDLGSGGVDQANAVALQADGKIVVAGWSAGSGGHHQLALVRYTADGRVDPGFGDHGRVLTGFGALPDGSSSEAEANAIAIQPDGRIVVGGSTTAPNGDENFALARYNPDGSLDHGFGDSTRLPGTMITDFAPALPDGRHSDEVINALVIQPDGKIVAAGKTNAPNGDDNFALVRYNPDGRIDTDFGHNTLRPGRVITDFRGFKDEIRAIALQADGKIVVAGRSNAPNGAGAAAPSPAGQGDLKAQQDTIVKLFTELATELQLDSLPAPPFDPQDTRLIPWQWEIGKFISARGEFQNIWVLQYENSYWAQTAIAGDPAQGIAGADGLYAARTFGMPTKVGAHDAILVVGHGYFPDNGSPNNHIVYLLWRCENLVLACEADGRRHYDTQEQLTQLQQELTADVQGLAATVDPKFALAGMCQPSQPADWNFALARYNPDGLLDASFGDNTQLPGQVLTDFRQLPDDKRSDDWANALVIQADGKIIAAGKSNSPNGDANFALVRYNPNGVIDMTFGDNTQQPGRVLTDFRQLASGSRSTDEIRAIAIQPEGRIVAAGYSDSPNGDNNFAAVRYNPDGIIDLSYSDSTQQPGRFLTDFRQLPDDSRSSDVITAIAIQPDAKIVAAGYSNSPNGDDNFALVRYYGTPTIGPLPGSAPTPPQPPAQINLIVTSSGVEVNGGTAVTGTVHLSQPAPAGGLPLAVKSDTISAATVTGSLTIPAGTTSGTFPITTLPVSAVTDVGIFVDFADPLSPTAGNPDDVDLSLRPGPAGTTPGTNPGTTPGTNPPPAPTGKIDIMLTLSAYKVKGGSFVTGTVTLSRPAPAGGVVLVPDVGDPDDTVSVPDSLTIPAGASSATFPIATHPVTAETFVELDMEFADAFLSIAGAFNGVELAVTP